MCGYVEPVEGQGSVWDHQTPGWVSCGVQTEAKTASPTLTPPGGFGCGVPTESMTASPTTARRNQSLSLSFAIGKIGTTIWKVTGSGH